MSETNLIVNYLPQNFDVEKLRSLFLPFGHLASCRIIFDEFGNSLCYGFVNFHRPEDAMRALVLNGLRIDNKKLKVAYALPSHSLNNKLFNLIVRNVPKSLNSLDLHHLFEKYGKIVSARVLYDFNQYQIQDDNSSAQIEKRISRGIGFVLFEKLEDANKAIEALSGSKINKFDPPLIVKMAHRPKFNRQSVASAGKNMMRPDIHYQQGVCLVVNNLNTSVTEWDLLTLFSPFGIIQWVRIARNSHGISKRFAYVHMLNYNEALYAIQALNGSFYKLFRIFVSIV